MPYTPRNCQVCTKPFVPPHRSILGKGDYVRTRCASCRRLTAAAEACESPAPELEKHEGAAPLTQIVFDLETWGLDRGWGTTLVASFLIHGGVDGPVRKTLKLRDYEPWRRGVRSDDSMLAKDIFEILNKGHIAYAHNGEYFDIRWLRTVALKYSLRMPKLKLIDPAAVSRQKYLVGRNSLEAMDDFMSTPEYLGGQAKVSKLHLSPAVWKGALLDDNDAAWALLVERCQSDVEVLNRVAGAVTGDVGMIDEKGSWR